MIFYHGGALGDIIYSLPTIRGLGGGTLCLGKYDQFKNIKDLLITQPYIENVVYRNRFKDCVNLSTFVYVEATLRSWKNIEHLAVIYSLITKQVVNLDLNNPWLFDIHAKKITKIVVNRTKKYRNVGAYKRQLDWPLLNNYKNDCVFVGTEKEHYWFNKETKIEIPYYKCNGALELAEVINGCDLFIGNQSFAFSIAEALKKNRILEVCWRLPNCIPATENGHIDLEEHIIRRYIK
jgi:hypothetical protein